MKHRVVTLIFVFLVAIVGLFLSEKQYFVPLIIAILSVYLAILTLGVLFMQFNYFLVSKTRLSHQKCLLTFDDGPDPETTPKILDILKKNEVSAIFFVIGTKVKAEAEIARRILAEGHMIGNHSNTHNNFMSLFTKKSLHEEIEGFNATIGEATGSKTDLFRPPIGYTNPRYASVLKKRNMKCVGWSLRSFDTVIKDRDGLLNRLLTKIRPGKIVLLHDNLPITADILDAFITKSKANGIIFATTSDIKTILDE